MSISLLNTILFLDVITQKSVPTALNNISLNEIPLNEASQARSMEINKYEYFKYNVLSGNKKHNNNNKLDLITNSENNRTLGSNTTTIIVNQENEVRINSNIENKTRLNCNIEQTKSDLSGMFLRKSKFSKANEKRKQTDNEFINLLDAILKRKAFSGHSMSKKTIFHNNITRNFTCLKSFLNKIFKSSQNAKSLGDDTIKLFRKRNIIDIFCNYKVPCKVRPEDEIKLQININDLNGEMYKILEIIKIMNSLLPEIKFANKKLDVTNKNSQTRNPIDIKLRSLNEKKLADKRHLLLYYLKDSFSTLLKCIEKFSHILYNILSILTGKDISKKSIYRALHSKTRNTLSKSNSKFVRTKKKIEILKLILLNYNILQNEFIKIIYNMLTKLESNNSNNEKIRKLSLGKDIRKAYNYNAMETSPKEIVENIRKLKKLAQKFSTKQRNKRSTMRDDDAIEYLLMLMEYLLKQNYPLDAAPGKCYFFEIFINDSILFINV